MLILLYWRPGQALNYGLASKTAIVNSAYFIAWGEDLQDLIDH